MPIDFTAVAARFGPPLARQTSQMTPLFEALGEAVKKLSAQAAAGERATRGYPVLRYYNGALCVHVDALGGPLLPVDRPLSLVEGLRAGGEQFLGGIAWTRTAVRQELALPGLLGVGRDALQAVVESIDRFARPAPAMFDARERRLSDVIGLLVLGYNSLLGLEARKQLVGVAGGAGTALAVVGELVPPDPSAAPSGGGGIESLVETLGSTSMLLLDVVVLLPILGDVLVVVIDGASLAAKGMLLTELGAVETDVHGLRAGAIEGLIVGADLAGFAAVWLAAAQVVIGVNLDIITTVAPSLLDDLLTGVRGFADGIVAWGTWATDLLETVRSVVDAIMSFDLFGFVVRLVLPPWLLAILPSPPSFTVDDLISVLIYGGALVARNTLLTFLAAALLVVPWWMDSLRDKIWAIAEVVGIVLTPRPFTLAPDVMPTTPFAGFPDIYDAFFGGGRAATLVGAVDRLGTEARIGIGTALGGAATLMGDLGETFAIEADRAASMGSVARMSALSVDAAQMAEEVFGPEAERARAQAAQRSPDQLALAFEETMTSGGFALVRAAIPAYVGELRSFWAQRRPPVEHATSPHILARHGRLAGVRVPRMTVRAAGHAPDRALAAQVAGEFRTAVGDAYLGGRGEFERRGGPPLRATPRGPAHGGRPGVTARER